MTWPSEAAMQRVKLVLELILLALLLPLVIHTLIKHGPQAALGGALNATVT